MEQLCQTGIQLLYLSHYLAYNGAMFSNFYFFGENDAIYCLSITLRFVCN